MTRWLLLLLTLSVGSTAFAAVSEIDGMAVDATVPPPPVCQGTMAYAVQESFTVPSSGIVRAIAAHNGGANYGAYIYQAGGATFLDYFTVIPFARTGTTVQLSASGGVIASPISAIALDIDEFTGKVFVTWIVAGATCASPSSGCIGVMRVAGSNLEQTNSTTTNRNNTVYGLATDLNHLYVRAEGTGAVGEDVMPAIHKITKATLAPVTNIRLNTTVINPGSIGNPAIDPLTNMLYTVSGGNTGDAYRIDLSGFTLLTTTAQGLAAGTLSGVTFASTAGPTPRVYANTNTTKFILRLDPTTLVSQTSFGVGLDLGGDSLIPDPANNSLHVQSNDGAVATSLQRVTIPVFANQNTIAGSFSVDIVGYAMPLNRIIETDRGAQTTLRSVKTCSAGP